MSSTASPCASAEIRTTTRTGQHKPPDDETLQRIRDAARVIAPLGVGPCVELDTSLVVDIGELVAAVRQA